MLDNNDDGIKRKFSAPLPRIKIIAFARVLSLVIAGGLLALTAHAEVSVRDIQLLLALDGYELDAKTIDGKLGTVTRAAIIDYRKKKNLLAATNDNELIDEGLFKSLYEDTTSKFFSLPRVGQSGTQETGDQDGNDAAATDVNSKSLDVYASAIAAIYAARHSTEETKDFYERFTWIFTIGLTVLTIAGTIFGIKSLKDVKSDLRKENKIDIRREKMKLANLRKEYMAAHQAINAELNKLSQQLEGKIEALDGTVADKIKKLDDKGHANLSASSVACSANISVNMYLYANKFGWTGEFDPKIFLDEADKLCKRALEINPQDPRVLSWIYGMQGIIFGEQKKLSECCEAFKKALDNDPDNVKTLCNAACGFALAKRNDEALDALKKATTLQPTICEWAKTEKLLNDIRSNPNFPCR